MIRQIVKEKNTIPIIGGFVAKSADPILAHVNPSRLEEQDLFILIQADQTILISPVNKGDQTNWTELPREHIQQSKSVIAPKTCYFKIQHNEHTGTYLISPDLIINEQFANEADYLKFIAL
jgi:hypothetical protein